MPKGLVAAMDRCGKAERRQALRAISRAASASGFDAACAAAERIFAAGRTPDDASCDVLARRIAAGAAGVGAASLSVYDAFVGEGAVGIAG